MGLQTADFPGSLLTPQNLPTGPGLRDLHTIGSWLRAMEGSYSGLSCATSCSLYLRAWVTGQVKTDTWPGPDRVETRQWLVLWKSGGQAEHWGDSKAKAGVVESSKLLAGALAP